MSTNSDLTHATASELIQNWEEEKRIKAMEDEEAGYDSLPHTFRVWFDDGSATLTNGTDIKNAREIVQAGIDSGCYYGKIASIEQLD